jgi:hypothetical protein
MSASKSDQLAAACTLSTDDALRVLGVQRPDDPMDPRVREEIGKTFVFSPAELAEYVHNRRGLAEELYAKSVDQRSSPSVFIQETAGGYNVGWIGWGPDRPDYQPSALRFHATLDDAATDFVLAYWQMARLEGETP